MTIGKNYLHKKKHESDEKSHHLAYLNSELKNRQQKLSQDVKISQNAPGQIFGQRADVVQSTADVAQSTTDVVQSVGAGRGRG